MFRFKLRTLLFFTAVFGLFLAGQVHVHSKAKRFVKELENPSPELLEKYFAGYGTGSTVESASIERLTLFDILTFSRDCEFISVSRRFEYQGTKYRDDRYKRTFRVPCFGDIHLRYGFSL